MQEIHPAEFQTHFFSDDVMGALTKLANDIDVYVKSALARAGRRQILMRKVQKITAQQDIDTAYMPNLDQLQGYIKELDQRHRQQTKTQRAKYDEKTETPQETLRLH